MPDELPNAEWSTKEKILRAALAVFLDVGFDRANLEVIAARAGVTKPTVYSHFGSKIGLLEAVAQSQSHLALSQFSPALQSSGDVRDDLRRFGKLFLTSLFQPDAIRMHRFAMVEAMVHPELVAPLLNAGPQRLAEALETFLVSETKAGRLRCKNPDVAAAQLLGLLGGMDFLTILLSQQTPTPSEIKKRIEAAVEVFLKTYAVSERDHEN